MGLDQILKETRSILLDKLLQDYDLTAGDIAEAVELYYDAQRLRIIHQNKGRSEGVSPLKEWFDFWLSFGEKVLTSKLRKWVEGEDSSLEAKWAYGQVGIGPVITAGLAAHIDVEKAVTVSSLWKFAGQAPGFDRRTKGIKLPYNGRLKTLVWKLGESFVKVSCKEGATYGKLYVQFKGDEVSRNENGQYAEVAAKELLNKKFKPDTVTRKRLEEGKLSDGHLHARAKRRAVKIFLAHYWLKGREGKGLAVSDPYIFSVGGHSKEHLI